MDGIQMEPVGKYKNERNGSAKASVWRNMVDQDLDDVAFLGDSEKAREANPPIAVCSQKKAICIVILILSTLLGISLLIVYAGPNDCPCLVDNSLFPGQVPTDADATAAANKERIASNGAVFPWRGARLPTFLMPKHYSLWLHPNLTTGELKGEVSIDFKVDRDTMFVVLNVRDVNITERALFKTGGSLGPKILKTLEYPQADQTYIEFKDKLRRKYNYTLSLRFVTKLERGDKQRGFFLAGHHKQRCAVSRFWLTHARSTFPCLDEPHFRATFKLTIVRDRFHVSLTNMPIVATEEAGFYLGHRLLQDEFAHTPPMSPHMMAMAICRLQRRAAPPLPTSASVRADISVRPDITVRADTPTRSTHPDSVNADIDEEDEVLPPPEISLYSDQQAILDESGPLLEWVQKTIQQFAYELNTSYPLPKLDIVVVDGGSAYSEGWGLITLAPTTLSDYKTIAKLLAQQWFGGVVSPRWWSSQWLMSALGSVLAEHADRRGGDALLLDHVLPALRLDASNSVRAVASPRLERADIESATDELSLHKGAAIVNMAIEAAGEMAGRAALARLLRDHRFASADARDLWRALGRVTAGNNNNSFANATMANSTNLPIPAHAWDGWCEKPGYPLLTAVTNGPNVVLTQERFLMSAEPPEADPPLISDLLTRELRADLEEIFFEPENFTEIIDDENITSTTPLPTTHRPVVKPTKAPPPPKWVIPLTFIVGPLDPEYEEFENSSKGAQNTTRNDSSETKATGSRWAQNVTHLVWMNDTQMVIPDLGKHKWVRYNVGARGLYRVAPQETDVEDWWSVWYQGGQAAGERALSLDDAFVLSRAGRLAAARAVHVAARLNKERHWAPWRVVLNHLSWWRELLQLTAVGPHFQKLLSNLHPPGAVNIYTQEDISGKKVSEDEIWLSGALLTAGVEWENEEVTKQAVKLFDSWFKHNKTIPEIYQEAAFTSGIRSHGAPAWRAVWRTLTAQYGAATAVVSRRALLAALTAASDDWLFYRFAWTVLSKEAQRSHEWKLWVTSLCAGACRWRGAGGAWRILRSHKELPLTALHAAARCLYQPEDYYQLKDLLQGTPGGQAILDMVAINAVWTKRAQEDLLAYFNYVPS